MDTPVILSFDTSGPYCAVAILRGHEVVAEHYEPMAKGQAERLMPLVSQALDAAGCELTDLHAIGVGIGPGNFTGIRIAVSAARGLALALDIPAVGVSLLEALALDARRPVLSCLAAPRGQLYLQRFADVAALVPALVAREDAEDWAMEGLTVVADQAVELPDGLRRHAVPRVHSPVCAIARIAAMRLRATDLPRPAPLYLRAADAAPSKETGPVILP